MYAIIDLETTGGNTNSDKIIEIAIILHNGEEVEDEWSTLINPEKRVPYRITGLTGISSDMVKGAPKFYEVAKKVVEMTQGRTIVAHNARFDYQFIRNAFKDLGYPFKSEVLCTLALVSQAPSQPPVLRPAPIVQDPGHLPDGAAPGHG